MKAYIICIIIALIFSFIAENLLKRGSNRLGRIALLLSLLTVCIIAGARSITVGTDVRGYVVRLVNVANTYPEFFQYMKNANSDFLFSILVYIGYLGKNMNFLLLLIEFAVAAPIYIYAYKERENVPITLTILIFMLNMYCLSLSMMRQSISISICILSFHYMNQKKYKKSLALILVAFLFHKTAIIFLTIWLLKCFFEKNMKYKDIFIPAAILILILLTPVLRKIISFTDYSDYLTNQEFIRSFSLGSILKRSIFILFWIICLGKRVENYRENVVIGLIISIISTYCTILSFYIPGMGRLGYYFFNLNNFITIQEFPKKFTQKRLITYMLVMLYVLFWWNMTYIPNDPAGVYPYHSDLVEFLN